MDNIGYLNNSVAIIGMSGIFPDAGNLTEFYENLRRGRDSVGSISETRLSNSSHDPSLAYRPLAHLDRIDLFDHKFFKISRRDAEFMEPVQKLFLELACQTIENAGYSLEELGGTDTAVYLAAKSWLGLQYYMRVDAQGEPAIFTGTLPSMSYGRISYALNLNGPNMMVDTGCSSSLVAIHQACRQLVHHEVDYALAGGLGLQLNLMRVNQKGHLGADAADGKCKAFDASADGMGSGEGGGMLLLKRLDRAIADRDCIHAVIRGSAVNHDGSRSNGITAPSPEAQTKVIKKAWQGAGIDPATIRYIETHGAGTKLGDPIEFSAITEAFKAFSPARKFCALSSVKTNLGHLGSGAGIAGMIKAVLSLQHKQLFPSVHFKTPNPFIDFENTAAYVSGALEEWTPAASPRRCGVSSFGLSGTNAHIVLEETPGREEPGTGGTLHHFVKISAKSKKALETYVRDIHAFLASGTQPLAHALYTLNRGRAEYDYRIGVGGKDLAEVLGKLAAAPGRIQEKQFRAFDKRQKEVVLLFGRGTLEGNITDSLSAGYDAAREALAEVGRMASLAGSDALRTFATQYALYQQLVAFGVPVKAVIGAGAGKLAKRVVTGEISLQEAVARIAGGEIPDAPPDAAKLKQVIQELHARNAPVFMEISADGDLGALLRSGQSQIRDLALAEPICNGRPADLLAGFTQLYNAGVTVNWKTFYAGQPLYRVTVPTYPFEKVRCWYEEPVLAAAPEARQWLHQLQWVREDQAPGAGRLTGQVFVVFADRAGLADRLIKHLETGRNACIRVGFGNGFRKLSASSYEIEASRETDHQRLAASLRQDFPTLNGILYLSNYAPPGELTTEAVTGQLGEGFYAQLFTGKAFKDQLAGKNFQFAVVTANACRVSPADAGVSPVHNVSVGLLKAMLAENVSLKVTGIDLGFGQDEPGRAAALIEAELAGDEAVRFVAYRHGERHAQVFSPLAAPAGQPGPETLPPGGVYLVTGGSSGIGYEIAKSLAARQPCTLLLLGRTALPPAEAWEQAAANKGADGHSEKISNLLALRQMGANPVYYAVDVSDPAAMAETFAGIRAKYPSLTGVVHSAGIGSSGIALADRELAGVQATLSPKVAGTLLLDQHTRDLSPSFFVLFSSIGTVVPSRTSPDYTAANAFEDAFAERMGLANRNVISINWPDWIETGLMYRKNLHRSADEIEGRNQYLKGLSTREGLDAFYAALALKRNRVIVVNADLTAFAVNPYFLLAGTEARPPAGSPAAAPVVEDAGAMTDTELALGKIWHEVLKVDSLKREDDFYQLGGHSLNIMRMLNKVEKQMGISVKMEEMLRQSTLQLLAAHIDALRGQGRTVRHEAIPPCAAAGEYALSHAQHRFWFLNELGQGREAYNVPQAYRFVGPVNGQALEKALVALMDRHESLRTTFRVVGGRPVQVVNQTADAGFALRYVDFRGEPQAEALAAAYGLKEAGTPFDLGKGPLVRATLLQLEDQHFIFLITLHHIVSDGRSMDILRSEVLRLYKDFDENRAGTLAPLRIQYKDFAAWHNDKVKSEAFTRHRAYWLEKLRGDIPAIPLPFDFAPGREANFASDQLRFLLDPPTVAALKGLPGNVTLFTGILSLFRVLLYKYSGQADGIIATPVGGREHPDLEDQIGIYLNTILLRTTMRADEPFIHLLNRVKEETIRDYEHQAFPFDLLVNELNLRQRDAAFGVGFTWNIRGVTEESTGLAFDIEDYFTGSNTAKADLWLHATETEQGVGLSLHYKTSRFKPQTIQLMAERFRSLIGQCLEDPNKPVGAYSLELFAGQDAAREAAFDFSF